MNKAKEILEQALSYKNCDGLIEENSRIEDVVLYAINEALRQPPVSGQICDNCGNGKPSICDKCYEIESNFREGY